MSKFHSPSLKDARITPHSALMLKYALLPPLIQNILENISHLKCILCSNL